MIVWWCLAQVWCAYKGAVRIYGFILKPTYIYQIHTTYQASGTAGPARPGGGDRRRSSRRRPCCIHLVFSCKDLSYSLQSLLIGNPARWIGTSRVWLVQTRGTTGWRCSWSFLPGDVRVSIIANYSHTNGRKQSKQNKNAYHLRNKLFAIYQKATKIVFSYMKMCSTRQHQL